MRSLRITWQEAQLVTVAAEIVAVVTLAALVLI